MGSTLSLLAVMLTTFLMGFWVWMAWDMSRNEHLRVTNKYYWTLAFIFLNVFAAVYYYVNEYRYK